MTTRDRENKINTHISTSDDKTIKSNLISSESKEIHTSSESPQKGQTAPSSKTKGSVWLRYSPRDRTIDTSKTA